MATLASNSTGHASTMRSIVAAWRSLTGGSSVRDADRRTMVACSAGADSSALAIALASAAPGSVLLAHVVHDLRPGNEALADRDAAQDLAARVGVKFHQANVKVAAVPGNDEANARHARYDALARLAIQHGCPFVATGHHADDQTETMLMAAARGAGLAGLSGIEPARPLSSSVTLVRPLLGITRDQAEAICAAHGWKPAVDRTNTDDSRTRARLRHEVLSAVRTALPSLPGRLSDTAAVLREADALVREQADALWPYATRHADSIVWPRPCFDAQSWLVVATHLRAAHDQLTGGLHTDSLALRVVRPVAELLATGGTSAAPKVFQWKGVTVDVDKDRVEMRLAGAHTRR